MRAPIFVDYIFYQTVYLSGLLEEKRCAHGLARACRGWRVGLGWCVGGALPVGFTLRKMGLRVPAELGPVRASAELGPAWAVLGPSLFVDADFERSSATLGLSLLILGQFLSRPDVCPGESSAGLGRGLHASALDTFLRPRICKPEDLVLPPTDLCTRRL